MNLQDLCRIPVLFYLKKTKRLQDLITRLEYTEIGLTGCVSELDKRYAKDNQLRPLIKFEKWLTRDYIKLEKERRQMIFQKILTERGIC
jgi:hypothetical protein